MEDLNALNSFLGEEEKIEKKTQSKEVPKKSEKGVFINQKDGLVERVDKVYVTNDGRQLLREVY